MIRGKELDILKVQNLCVSFQTRRGKLRVVHDVSFTVRQGKTLALVGESGSGKSVTAMSILRLLDKNGEISSGQILFHDGGQEIDLTQLDEKQLCAVRGNKISVIFQEPMTALNPVLTVQRQLCEPFLIHRGYTKAQAEQAAKEMLIRVGLSQPERVLKGYAHELSGGMRQRVMIAMALACEPKLLIADEPTTALDVTIQAQILALMRDLQKSSGAAILFITHDLGVVGEMADDVAVTYCGEIVERVPAPVLFQKDGYSHPYTEALLRCIPSAVEKGDRLESIKGATPQPFALPTGCKFSPRCKYRTEKCFAEAPPLAEVEDGHCIRCFYPQKAQRKGEVHAKLIVD